MGIQCPIHFCNRISIRPTRDPGPLSEHAIHDVDRGVVIPIDEGAFRLVGRVAPLQVSRPMFRVAPSKPFHKCGHLVVEDRHPKLVRVAHVETTHTFLESETRRHAYLALSIAYKFKRPVGHFQRLVLCDGRLHAMEEFGERALVSSVQAQCSVGPFASRVCRPKARVAGFHRLHVPKERIEVRALGRGLGERLQSRVDDLSCLSSDELRVPDSM